MLAQKIERDLLSLTCKVPCCESREVDAQVYPAYFKRVDLFLQYASFKKKKKRH